MNALRRHQPVGKRHNLFLSAELPTACIAQRFQSLSIETRDLESSAIEAIEQIDKRCSYWLQTSCRDTQSQIARRSQLDGFVIVDLEQLYRFQPTRIAFEQRSQ